MPVCCPVRNTGAEEQAIKKPSIGVIEGIVLSKISLCTSINALPCNGGNPYSLNCVSFRTVCYGLIVYERFTALHQPAALWESVVRIQRRTAPINAFVILLRYR